MFYKTVTGLQVIFDIHLEPVFLTTQFSSVNPLYSQHLLSSFRDELLKSKNDVLINKTQIPILEHNHLIVYLVLHLFHDNYHGYNNYFLIDILLRHQQTDFHKILSILINYKLINFTTIIFMTLKNKYLSPIPPYFISQLTDFTSSKYSPLSYRDMFSQQNRIEAGVSRFKSIFLLSSEPIFKKITIFFQPEIVFFVFLSFYLLICRKLKAFYYSVVL